MKTDSLFYRLFQRSPGLVLELAGLDFDNAEAYRFCSEEIKQTAFRLDGILTPETNHAGLPLIFVEVQFQPDADFYSRFFCEIFCYLHQNKPLPPWQAVVIYPTRQVETDGSRHYSFLLESDWLKRIYLEDLNDLPADRMGLRLIQLIVTDEEKAINTARNLINHIKIDTHQETTAYWLEWVESILVYKLPKLSREEIQKMLGYNDIELKQTRFYQDVYTEGRQEGHQEGHQEGLHEGEAKIILRLLKHRFGKLSPKTITNIQQLNSEQLETTTDKMFDFASQKELNAWLKKLKDQSHVG